MTAYAARLSLALVIVALSCVVSSGCGADSSSGSGVETGPLTVSGGGSKQFREPGLDNTIEEYGREADREELKRAATVVHSYLVALVEEDWAGACAYLSKFARDSIMQEFIALKRPEGKTCAGSLSAWPLTLPGRGAYEKTMIDAGSLRTRGDFGYLFFDDSTGGHKFALEREDGEWKVYTVGPTSLH